MEKIIKTKNGSIIIYEEIYDQQALKAIKQLNKSCEKYFGSILNNYKKYLQTINKN